MHLHTHGREAPAQTEGRMIRWASFYDVFANIMTLGHIRRLRALTTAVQAFANIVFIKFTLSKLGRNNY
jgi:hypothetical protein